MANVIGQLLIELGVNTAYLQEGFAKATHATKSFGKEVESTFRELGKSTSELAAAFGVLGPAGAELAGAFNLAGQAAGKMMREFAGVSSTFGVFAAGAAGAAAAFTTIGLAAVGLATKTAAEIKEMKESATIAGMTTTEFTRFGYAAKQAGVSQEGFTSSMSRFGNKMVQAAQGNKAASAEFDMMGVKVTDTNGKMRAMGDVLLDVSDWFAKTADGAVKNNAAMTIGGRGFKQMIPLLNEGRDGMKEWADEADALGVTVDKNTADMMDKYTQTITAIKTAGDGLAIQLSKELIPALQGVATAIKEDLKSPDSDIKKFVEGIAAIAHWFVDLVAISGAAFAQIGQQFKTEGATWILTFRGIKDAGSKALKGDFSGAKSAWKQSLDDIEQVQRESAKQTEARWVKVWAVIDGDNRGAKTEKEREDPNPPKINKGAGIGQNNDEIAKWIRAQRLAAQAALDLGKAIGESNAAIDMNTAKVKAQEELQKRMGDLEQKRAEHVKSLNEATTGETKNKAQAEKFRALVENDNKQIAELKQFSDEYIAIEEEKAVREAALSGAKEIGKKRSELQEQIAAQKQLADAIKQGGDAYFNAKADEALKDRYAALKKLTEEGEIFAKEHPNETAKIQENAEALAINRRELEALHAEKAAELKAEMTTQLAEETKKIDAQTAAIKAEADALRLTLQQRNALKAHDAGEKYKAAHPGATDSDVTDYVAATQRQLNTETIYAAAKRKEDELDILKKYQEEKNILDAILADNQASAGVKKLAAIQEQQNLDKVQRDYADMLEKSNNISDVMLGWATKLSLELPKLGNDLGQDLIKAVDQFNSALINAIGTGKINFHSLLTSIAKDFATTALKGTEGLIASLFTGGGKKGEAGATGGVGGMLSTLFGGKKGDDGKPKGTALDPIYTTTASSVPGVGDVTGSGDSGGDISAPGGLSGLFSGLFGKLSGMLGGLFGSIGGVFGKVLGGLGGMFGGFLASGGDVTPGKAYVVGEHHPEFFIPRASGHVAPVMKTGDGAKSYVSNVHFHGITDADSFRRSQSQVMQSVGFGMSAALGRK